MIHLLKALFDMQKQWKSITKQNKTKHKHRHRHQSCIICKRSKQLGPIWSWHQDFLFCRSEKANGNERQGLASQKSGPPQISVIHEGFEDRQVASPWNYDAENPAPQTPHNVVSHISWLLFQFQLFFFPFQFPCSLVMSFSHQNMYVATLRVDLIGSLQFPDH